MSLIYKIILLFKFKFHEIKRRFSLLLISGLFFLGCGTHGKIEWFPFEIPKDSIVAIINKITGNDSIYFIPNDRTDYKDVFIKSSTHFKVFSYRFYGDSTIYWNDDKNQSCIALIYVKDGDSFKNEKDLNPSEKKISINDFNDHFIALIKQQIVKIQK